MTHIKSPGPQMTQITQRDGKHRSQETHSSHSTLVAILASDSGSKSRPVRVRACLDHPSPVWNWSRFCVGPVMQTNVNKHGDERTFGIIGAAMEVHRILGTGFLEVFYRDALAIELGIRSIPFETEAPCNVIYKGHRLRGHYHMDFVCFGSIVVEVKARSAVGPAEQAQVLSYLASSKHQIGLLLNFGASKLEHHRFVLTKPR